MITDENLASKREKLATLLEVIALASVTFPFAMVALSAVLFSLGFRINGWIMPLAVIFTVSALRALTGSGRITALAALISAGIHLIALLIATHCFDGSWDGLAYHQEAVLRLNAGWNPWSENSESYGKGHDSIWIDSYPKASWIAGAVMQYSEGQIESGKLFNFSIMIAAAGLVAALLLRITRLRVSLAVILAGLTALNPVVICQCTTFYVDGLMASLITVLVAALFLMVARFQWTTLALGMTAACLLINLKFTGLIYAAILIACAVAYALLHRKIHTSRRLVVSGLIAGVVGTFLMGYAPYVRNLREKGELFYPVTGVHKLLDPSETRPANLTPHNRFLRFAIANFSESGSARPPKSTQLKCPFRISRGERSVWYRPDVEAGGFGPLFSGILIVSVCGLIVLFLDSSTRKNAVLVSMLAASLALSIFCHSESWWARYAPQAWLLPLLIIVPCLLARNRIGRLCGWFLIGLVTIDVLFVGYYAARSQLTYTGNMRHTLQAMTAEQKRITVYFGPFPALRQRLIEAGIQAQISEVPLAVDPSARIPIPCPGNQAYWTK